MVNGNVSVSQAQKGNLSDLKKAGLLTTTLDDGCTWVDFTDAGIEYAVQNGIHRNDIDIKAF